MWSTGRSRVGGLAVGMVRLGVVVAAGVVGARGAYPAARRRLLSGAAWLASTQVGQLTVLDGSSAEVAAQVGIAPPGNQLGVAQQGSVAYAVDRTAGSIRRVDGTTFEPTPAAAPLPDARDGLRAFAGTDVLYVLDTRRGVLTAADPYTLVTQGRPVSLTARVSPQAATLDGAGRLWVLDPDSGDLVWLRDGQRHSRHVGTGSAQLTVADGAPVLVDTAHRTATSFDPASGAPRRTFPLDLRADDKIQAIGAAHDQRLYVVAARGVLTICDLTGPGCGLTVPIGTRTSDFGAPVEAGGRVFVPDYATGQVWVADVAAPATPASSTAAGRGVRVDQRVDGYAARRRRGHPGRRRPAGQGTAAGRRVELRGRQPRQRYQREPRLDRGPHLPGHRHGRVPGPADREGVRHPAGDQPATVDRAAAEQRHGERGRDLLPRYL